MEMPTLVTADDSGHIHAKGRRIALHHVIRLHKKGYSPEMLSREYPTRPLAPIHGIVAF